MFAALKREVGLPHSKAAYIACQSVSARLVRPGIETIVRFLWRSVRASPVAKTRASEGGPLYRDADARGFREKLTGVGNGNTFGVVEFGFDVGNVAL
jgi:hypothetical protein